MFQFLSIVSGIVCGRGRSVAQKGLGAFAAFNWRHRRRRLRNRFLRHFAVVGLRRPGVAAPREGGRSSSSGRCSTPAATCFKRPPMGSHLPRQHRAASTAPFDRSRVASCDRGHGQKNAAAPHSANVMVGGAHASQPLAWIASVAVSDALARAVHAPRDNLRPIRDSTPGNSNAAAAVNAGPRSNRRRRRASHDSGRDRIARDAASPRAPSPAAARAPELRPRLAALRKLAERARRPSAPSNAAQDERRGRGRVKPRVPSSPTTSAARPRRRGSRIEARRRRSIVKSPPPPTTGAERRRRRWRRLDGRGNAATRRRGRVRHPRTASGEGSREISTSARRAGGEYGFLWDASAVHPDDEKRRARRRLAPSLRPARRGFDDGAPAPAA